MLAARYLEIDQDHMQDNGKLKRLIFYLGM